jgi:hypothetical protein
MTEPDMFVVDQKAWESMTEIEQGKYLQSLLKQRKSFILNGVKHVYDPSLGPISMSLGG